MADATVGLHQATIGLRNFTIALVVIAVVSAGVSALQWWEIHSGSADTSKLAEAAVKGAEAANGQLDEMRIERRPWVSLEVIPNGKFTITKKEASINLTVSVKNSGNIPATNVLIHSMVMPFNPKADSPNPDRKCSTAADNGGFGRALFPGENFQESNMAFLEDGFDIKDMQDGASYILGTVNVCITYTEAAKGFRPHKTIVTYLALTLDNKGGVILWAITNYAD